VATSGDFYVAIDISRPGRAHTPRRDDWCRNQPRRQRSHSGGRGRTSTCASHGARGGPLASGRVPAKGPPATLMLRFGTATSDRVQIFRPFGNESDLVIGRTAIRRRQCDDREGHLVWGAAAGQDIGDVRRRAFGELVERTSWIESSASGWAQASGDDCESGSAENRLPGCAWCRWESGAKPTIRARYALSDEWAQVPARLVFQPSASQSPGQIRRVDATGLAAARSPVMARRRALLEVIERHTALLAWKLPGFPVSPVPLGTLGPRLVAELMRRKLNVLLLAAGDAALPKTHIAVLTDKEGRSTVGTACGRPRGSRAAVFEALMLRWTVLQSDVEGSQTRGLARVVAAAHQPATRAWFVQQLSGQRRPSMAARSTADVPLVRRIVYALGADPLVVDVSTARARGSGWSVVRAIIPGAVRRECVDEPTCTAAISAGVVLGLGGRQGMNPIPHPFG
jgi:ribosomal protein S12 methylthiotransferase accessory factor YcaO